MKPLEVLFGAIGLLFSLPIQTIHLLFGQSFYLQNSLSCQEADDMDLSINPFQTMIQLHAGMWVCNERYLRICRVLSLSDAVHVPIIHNKRRHFLKLTFRLTNWRKDKKRPHSRYLFDMRKNCFTTITFVCA